MANDVMIAPSILSADFAKLGADVEDVQSADYLHVDIMDGHFVPNISFGPSIVKAAKTHSSIPLDVHLMVTNPDDIALDYVAAGASNVTFHYEAALHAHRLVGAIHDAGATVGIALNPGTPVCMLEDLIEDIDLVLVMSVNPGFGGQSFIEHSLVKYKQVRALAEEHKCNPIVETDGGVSAANAAKIVEAGANLLVAGSSVYNQADRAAAIAEIRAAGQKGLMRSA